MTARRPTLDRYASADDIPALDVETEAAIEAVLAAAVPVLRANLHRELAARLPHLRLRVRRERVALRPGDEDAPVDDLSRAKARAILDRHAISRGRR